MIDIKEAPTKWYHGITKYQWLILAIACAGWIFDVYEGQIFNITRGDMLNDLLSGIEDEVAKKAAIDKWGDWFLVLFSSAGRPVVCCLVRWLIAMVAVR